MTGFYGWSNVQMNSEAAASLLNSSCDFLSHGITETALISDSHSFACKTSNNSAYNKTDDHITFINGISYITNNKHRDSSIFTAEKHLKSLVHDNDFAELSKINGQFSLAHIDITNKSLLLATDKLSTKPVFYAQTPNGIVYGSSASSIKLHPLISRKIDYQSIYNFIYFHVIPSPRTIYSAIKKLPPAHFLYFSDGKLHVDCYWKPSFTKSSEDFSSLRSTLKNSVHNSVEFYGVNNNTGTFLSGGIDSSTVSGVYSSQHKAKVKSYSMGFSQSGYNEIEYAKIAQNKFNLDLNEYYVTTEDILESFKPVMTAYDEPFGNSSAIPTYMCAKFARSCGSEYLLAGDGGDELFAGNERYLIQKLYSYYHAIPSILRRQIVEPVFLRSNLPRYSSFSTKIMKYIKNANIPMPDRMETYNFIHRLTPNTIFTEEFLKEIDTNEPSSHIRSVYNSSDTTDLINKMLFYDWRHTLADNDLRKVGKMTELAGIDVYYPLLDDEILEFSTQIPTSLLLKRKNLRYFFKKSYSDVLPKEIINKSKHGFGLPFGEWLKTSQVLQNTIYTYLEELKGRAIFNNQFIDEIIQTHKTGHASYYGTLVWLLASFEAWMQCHNERL